MITFIRSGKSVKAEFETGLNSDPKIYMSFECSSEMCAEMLYLTLRNKLWERIEAIRLAEFEDGYKAGRSKTKKRKYFYSSLENKEY